jgi:hypothetical protein
VRWEVCACKVTKAKAIPDLRGDNIVEAEQGLVQERAQNQLADRTVCDLSR